MVKRIIIAIVIFTLIMSGVTFWIFNSVDSRGQAANARSESDFTTQQFVVQEIWEMQKKKGASVISSYFFIKIKNEPFKLRLPWQGARLPQEELLNNIKEGDTLTVKVLKEQLAEARENGAGKAVSRFIMGDKREVTVFKMEAHGEVLTDKDIHGWDEAEVTLLGRLADQPYILLVPAFILFAIIGFIKRRKAKAAPQNT